MPAVSVIIPTYNHQDFVLETLESVFAQTFTDYEVIVIVDGSPDNTASVLRPLAESGRIHCIVQENTGQSQARNRGLAEARGEFIAFLDDDDLWPPDKLEWQVKALARHPEAGLVAGPATIIDASGHPLSAGRFIPEVTFEDCLIECPFISPGQALIRADILKQVHGLNPEIWGTDDWDLWLRIVKASRVFMEDRVALLYRRHAGNASKNLGRMVDNCFRVLDLHLVDVADEKRRRVRQAACRRLYDIHGKAAVIKIKDAAKSGELRLVPAYVVLLARFGTALRRDPSLVLHLLRDFLPVRWAARPLPTEAF